MMNYIKTLAVAPDFSRARLLSGATEPPLSLMRDFHDITGADVIHAYGATETTPLVAVNRGLKPSLRGVISDEEKWRSEEHTSELQSLMRNSYAVFCLKKKKKKKNHQHRR